MPLSRFFRPRASTILPGLYSCVTAVVVSGFLGGCGGVPVSPVTSSQVVTPGVALHGNSFGGQQPVNGGTVQLYAAGTDGVASAATALLKSTVTTDAGGGFNITDDYTCPAGAQVYLVVTGGDPGIGTQNPQLALMAALGACSSLSSSTYINVNEITTVASVAALLGYMNDFNKLGSTSSDSGLTTAFGRVSLLVSSASGTVAPATTTSWGFATQPTQLVALANSVAACINSSGGTAGTNSNCGSLLSDAIVSGQPAPTNTVAALVNILSNPTKNVSAIYDLAGARPPFQPTLSEAPANWSLALYAPAPVVSVNGYTVSMTVASPAVQIRYTTDGSTPSTSSASYSGSFSVNVPVGGTVTVKAIGVDAKGVTSSVSSTTVQRIPVPAPEVSFISAINGGDIVTITAESPAVQIRYTLDGSTPTTNSTLYNGIFLVNPGIAQSVTVKAIGLDAQGGTSSVSTTIIQGPAAPAPVLSVNGYTVTMTVGAPAVQIRYTLDGSTPTASSTLYTGPVTVSVGTDQTVTVRAVGVTAQHDTGNVATVNIQGPLDSGGGGGGGGCGRSCGYD